MTRVSAVLTSTSRSFHYHGARTDSSGASHDRQPVEGSEQGGYIGVSRKVEDQTSCCILDEFERSDPRGRKASPERVAVVQARQNHRLDPELGRVGGEKGADSPDVV